ncbi:C40 family peptidase [Hydrogenobaculum acidophilum]
MKKVRYIGVFLAGLVLAFNVAYGSEFVSPIRQIINYHKYGQDIYKDPILNIIQKSKVELKKPQTISELVRYSIGESPIPKKIISDKFDKKLVKRLIAIAKQYLGTPYRFGGTSRYGIDCSGFTMKVFDKLGIKLPRTASEQAHMGKLAINLKPGDLLFFKTYRKHHPGHVGIYIGHGLMIDASSAYGKVVIEPINQPYFKKHFLFAKSLF